MALSAIKNANPITIKAAIAYLAVIEAQQQTLQAKQQSIISSSKRLAKIEVLKIKGQNYKGSPPFSLIPKPPNSITPSYYLPKALSKAQDLTVPWKIINSLKHIQKGVCGSHIKRTPTGLKIKYSYPVNLL